MLKVAASLFLFTLLFSGSVLADEIITLKTRPGVTQTFAVFEPADDVEGVMLLLPGHAGVVYFDHSSPKIEVTTEWGGITAKSKTRHKLVNKGFVVAMVAAPSDHPKGMENPFRASHENAVDLSHVIGYLKSKYPDKPFYVWGQSRSTISAVNLVAANNSVGIDGLILTSTWQLAIQGINPSAVTLPVLIVHHKKDICTTAPFSGVDKLVDFFRYSKKVSRINVVGGEYIKKGPGCRSNVHGMGHVASRLVNRVVKWINGEDIRRKIRWDK